MRFVARVDWHDDYDFLAGIAASCDDGYAADLEDCVVGSAVRSRIV